MRKSAKRPQSKPGAELSPREFPHIEDTVSLNRANYRPPKILSIRNPEYPFDLRRRGIKAVVKVDFIVGVDGLVREVYGLDAPHPLFVTAVLTATHDWRFEPGLRDGRPASVKIVYTDYIRVVAISNQA